VAGGPEYEVKLEEIAREGLYDQVAFRLPEGAIPTESMAWITGSIDGRAFEANTSPHEEGGHWVFIPVELREQLSIGVGDQVRVSIDPLEERPEVPAPDDFREALAVAGAGLDFEQLTAGQRGEYVRWISEVEGEERTQRIRRAVEGIRDRRAPREVVKD
jgi:Bacteriocin-protection, YdeI or OmpD-Associated/Domain of unknown function (DUF1905)